MQPGDTLSGIAASAGISVADLAAANGLDPAGILVAGTTLAVAGRRRRRAGCRGAGSAPAGRAPTPCDPATRSPASPPGAGVAMADMAAMNGLDPDGVLVAGTVLKLPAARRRPRAPPSPRRRRSCPQADPAPTAGHASAPATSSPSPSQYGVSPSLAAAIAWQESGFNNAMVSSANARGVMQVMPGTWDYVQQNLAQRPLDPNSATDNVHAGVMYLKQLLDETGGDENTAIAGYYQGLQSVRDRGMYDDTQQLRGRTCRRCAARFGG